MFKYDINSMFNIWLMYITYVYKRTLIDVELVKKLTGLHETGKKHVDKSFPFVSILKQHNYALLVFLTHFFIYAYVLPQCIDGTVDSQKELEYSAYVTYINHNPCRKARWVKSNGFRETRMLLNHVTVKAASVSFLLTSPLLRGLFN